MSSTDPRGVDVTLRTPVCGHGTRQLTPINAIVHESSDRDKTGVACALYLPPNNGTR